MGVERMTRLEKLVLVFMAAIACMQRHHSVDASPRVPCLFIFGDSLSDSGNNNNLPTDAKVNYFPYGIDFPAGPSGRFTNGRTAVDFLTEILGFQNLIPPFANTSGSDILEGVNYASGSAGIRKETGTQLGEDVSFEQQLINHRTIFFQISNKLGGVEQAKSHLNKCLYYVNIGSNDYINNYFKPQYYPASKNYNPHQYAEVLIQEYSRQLRALYELGARKFALVGLGGVGCTPFVVSKYGNSDSVCVEELNKEAMLFNDKLKPLVDQLKIELCDAKFTYINIVALPTGMQHLPGEKQLLTPCCKIGSNGQCLANMKPCSNRNLHMFWDGFHPTEIVNKLIAKSSYNTIIPNFAYRMDISHLIRS